MTKEFFKYLIILLLIFNNFAILYSFGSSGSQPKYENRKIVDLPHCGMLTNNHLGLDFNFIKNGALMVAGEYSFLNFINAGISLGANNVIGDDEIVFQKYPGLNLKFRILDESLKLPAIALGFSNQGFSGYLDNLERYNTLSPGLFLVFSKSFNWKLGYLASHLGINYSFENEESSRTPNIYFGIEQSISSNISANIEYNFQLDEVENKLYDQNGLLNLSIRAGILQGMTIELQLKDILLNYKNSQTFYRQLVFEIIRQLNF
jgi:hypothetical protein